MGIEIVQGKVGATVGAVVAGSKAQQMGILEGDLIVATSATAGDSLWTHENAESIKSAINTRFVMSPTVKLRLERSLLDIDEEILAVLKVQLTLPTYNPFLNIEIYFPEHFTFTSPNSLENSCTQ
jgi:hypothetical protein